MGGKESLVSTSVMGWVSCASLVGLVGGKVSRLLVGLVGFIWVYSLCWGLRESFGMALYCRENCILYHIFSVSSSS